MQIKDDVLLCTHANLRSFSKKHKKKIFHSKRIVQTGTTMRTHRQCNSLVRSDIVS